MRFKVKLDRIADVQEFADVATKYSNLYVEQNKLVVLANSLMGLFSLNLINPIVVNYDCDATADELKQIKADFGKWSVDNEDN